MTQNYAGQILKSYELKELIDTGGFGAVYRANQAVIEREVAIKIIFPEHASHPNFIRRFEAEAQVVAGLEHPYIVPLYDYWRDPEGAYIVMRWLRGGHLRTLMQNGPMLLSDAARLIEQIATALIFAHRYGVVHRDLKPENVLLDEAGNAYLADFGIAQIMSSSRSDDESTASMGSPAYAAPEQMSDQPATQATDEYSLGVILFEMLVGMHPFPDLSELTLTELTMRRISEPLPPLSRFRPDLPVSLGQMIQRATALDSKDRYPDVTEMLRAFQAAIEPLVPSSRAGRASALATRTQQLAALSLDLPNPYKGLRTFQESDAANFFGRKDLVDRLIRRLRETGEFSRFLTVVGPSGSGKSSIVKAGLIPALRAGALKNSSRWFYVEMLPGVQPFKELETALISVAVQPPQDLSAHLQENRSGLLDIVQQILPNDPGAELFLFIDQFEELFTQADDAQRDRFLESLYIAVSSPMSRIRIVVTLRADFYDRPLLHALISEMMRQRTEVVTPLKAAELSEAITEPAQRLDVHLEPGLEVAISSEMIDHPAALPLFQYLMSELFQRRQGVWMTLDAYRQIGGVRGALAKRAEEIYEQFPPAQRAAMQQLMLRLITLGEGTEDTRRRALISEVQSVGTDSAVMRTVVDTLGKTRLLTFDRDPETRSPTVEVTHEAIIREWRRLREWLDTSRNDVRTQRSLAALAAEWLDAQEDASYLLRDARLRQFEAWSHETTVDLTPTENRYLSSSLQEQQKRQTIEIQRAGNERKLELQSRNRLRILVAVMAIALVIGFILTGYALTESQRAQVESDISQSLAQASGALRALTDGDSDLAVVLALAANEGANASPQALRTLTEVAFSPGTRAVITGHESSVMDVDIDHAGSTIASGSRDSHVRLWSVTNGSLIHDLIGHRGDVQVVAFSPDGRFLASGGLDFLTFLWDVETGQQVHTFAGHSGAIRTLAFSPDGHFLVTGSRDAALILWNVETGEAIRTLNGHTTTVQAVAYSLDGKIIVSGAGDGTLISWDAATGAVIRTWTGSTAAVNALDFDETGMRLVSALADGALELWDVQTGETIYSVRIPDSVALTVALLPDGQSAMVGLRTGTVAVIDLATGRALNMLRGHEGEVYSVALSRNGRLGVSGSADSTIRLWNILNPAEQTRFADHTGRITGLAFTADGSALVTSSVDQTVLVYDAATGAEMQRIMLDSAARALALMPNGEALVGTQSGTVQRLDLIAGTAEAAFRLHQNPILALALSADGRVGVSSAQGERLKIWNAATGAVTRTLDEYNDTVLDLALRADGKMLLFGADDNTVVLWDIEHGIETGRLIGQVEAVSAVAFSADGTRVAAGSRDGVILVWDVNSHSQQLRLTGHARDVWSIAFSADGRTLISVGGEGAVIRWDLETGEEIERFTSAVAPALKVAINPASGLVASGADQGIVQIWRLFERSDLIDWTRGNRFLRDLTCQERTLYRVEPYCS